MQPFRRYSCGQAVCKPFYQLKVNRAVRKETAKAEILAAQMINIQRNVSIHVFLNKKQNTRNYKPYPKCCNYVSKVS